MRVNLPVTNNEYDFPADELLMSTTDTKGVLTHCNAAFARVSGFTMEELMGQPHNIIRHPDMPPEAYKDMWSTIGRGRSWTGFVKNRRKNGDFYWTQAPRHPHHARGQTGGLPVGAHQAHARAGSGGRGLVCTRQAGAPSPGARPSVSMPVACAAPACRDHLRKRYRSGPTLRLAAMMLPLMLVSLVPGWMGWNDGMAVALQTLAWLVVAGLVLARYHVGMTLPIRSLRRLLNGMAAGDLTHREPELPMTHVLGKVMARVQRLQLNIRAVVGDAMEEMERFSGISAEIAQSAQDLSGRAESQASSLEESAAAMEQLSATVENSSEAAQKVVRESHHSAELATQGGQAVAQVSQVVGAIEQSSRKMGQIISTIEGIAFQTNILALNAAVEAARAGEQGRGFAVVAGEVRSLAQRSSEAAKEIQALINESASNIGRGAGLMQSASKTIEQVVQSVAHVNTLMGQMGVAAREQAEGISQVNEAVTLLDRDTQQNAALAEQSAASSRVMSDSAAVLGPHAGSVPRALRVVSSRYGVPGGTPAS